MKKELLAPNRKPSNLNAEQYDLVRTTAFKNWFGDWEKLALTKFYDSGIDEVSLSKLESNVSKVIDENGEPLVVYHGSYNQINEFSVEVNAHYFTNKRIVAETYGNNVLSCFLNIKNPVIWNANCSQFNDVENYINKLDSALWWAINKNESSSFYGVFVSENTDGVIVEDIVDTANEMSFEDFTKNKNKYCANIYMVSNSNQIKLADGTNTTFDSGNDDIRFAKGGKTKGDCYLVAGQIAMEIRSKKINYKGTPYLVHAEVRHSQIDGLRYGHAFIEDDENVYDFSNNREIIMPKQIYYYFGDINPRDKKKYRKYTFKEAREKMLSTGNYGCWDIEVDYEKGGRFFNDEELLAKWKKGESIGFTAVAHLKSKGLIPRADGVKRKSEKYMENGGMTNADGFVIEELDNDLKEVYQNRALKNIGGSDFYFSRLNIYPDLNVFTIELPSGKEVGKATLNEKGNYLTNIRLDYDYRRRGLASNLYDYIESVTGKKLNPSPDKISIEAQKLWLKRNPDIQFKNGGTTISQTPAPKKDQVQGSDVNKSSSSKDLSSAKLIKFDDKTLVAIKNKVKEHNEEHPDKKINLSSAKAVVRRGFGAYSKSHRPTISGGKPNSRVAWGLARLNAFTFKIVNGKSKSGKYSQDDDLIEELGFKVANYNNGGKMSKDIRCINCGWEWNKKDSELWDMYVCHKCGFDNTTFYTSIPVNNYSKGGKVESKNPDYLKMFLGK